MVCSDAAAGAPRSGSAEATLRCFINSPKRRNAETPKHRSTEAPKHRSTEAPKHRNAETPKHRNTETPKHRNTETPKHRNTETPKHQSAGAPERGPVAPAAADAGVRRRFRRTGHAEHPAAMRPCPHRLLADPYSAACPRRHRSDPPRRLARQARRGKRCSRATNARLPRISISFSDCSRHMIQPTSRAPRTYAIATRLRTRPAMNGDTYKKESS